EAGQRPIAGTKPAWLTGERLKTLLIAAFLGILGGHCFYTRRWGRGLLELLFVTGGIASPLMLPKIVSTETFYEYSTVLSIVSVLPYIAFLALYFMDIINIFKGKFTKVDPTIKLTKKHLVFLGILLGLEIVSVFVPPSGYLVGPLVSLCGVFFGIIPGTIIAGLLTLIWEAGILFRNYGFSLTGVLWTCVTTAITALIVYGYLKLRSPESKLNLTLPDLTGKPVLQGAVIGAAYLAACVLSMFFLNLLSLLLHSGFYRFSFRDIVSAAIAGFIGAALPLLLAKKGLYLGPFVTPAESADEKASSGTEGAA
ncbi:MAG: hypothetical protein LBI67_00640, partial [Treponema sp.]|nr:hypothetical protein [Treponema sp.]